MKEIMDALREAYLAHDAADAVILGFIVNGTVLYAEVTAEELIDVYCGKSKTSDEEPVFRWRVKALTKRLKLHSLQKIQLYFVMKRCCSISQTNSMKAIEVMLSRSWSVMPTMERCQARICRSGKVETLPQTAKATAASSNLLPLFMRGI